MSEWKPARTAVPPKEVENERPVLVLVSGSHPPDAGKPWCGILAYRTKHNGWKAYDDDTDLGTVHWWLEIPALPSS
jgi:hypothetical protein